MQSICDVCDLVTLWKEGGNQTSQLFVVCSLLVELLAVSPTGEKDGEVIWKTG